MSPSNRRPAGGGHPVTPIWGEVKGIRLLCEGGARAGRKNNEERVRSGRQADGQLFSTHAACHFEEEGGRRDKTAGQERG